MASNEFEAALQRLNQSMNALTETRERLADDIGSALARAVASIEAVEVRVRDAASSTSIPASRDNQGQRTPRLSRAA